MPGRGEFLSVLLPSVSEARHCWMRAWGKRHPSLAYGNTIIWVGISEFQVARLWFLQLMDLELCRFHVMSPTLSFQCPNCPLGAYQVGPGLPEPLQVSQHSGPSSPWSRALHPLPGCTSAKSPSSELQAGGPGWLCQVLLPQLGQGPETEAGPVDTAHRPRARHFQNTASVCSKAVSALGSS